MVRAVVLDIDGVIIGNLPGVNFPYPSEKVSSVLNEVHNNGIPVCFLTGKTTFAAWKNLSKIGIDNPHIADGGAVIFNPVQGKIIKKEILNKESIEKLIALIPECYFNFFTTDNYYLLSSSKNEYTDIYSKFIGKEPVLISSFEEIFSDKEISKLNISSFNTEDKEKITKALEKLSDEFNFSWSRGPNTGDVETAVVTSKLASKKQGVRYLSDYLNVDLNEVLGVGDTIHDWDFIEICGYKGVMGNATDELKSKFDHTKDKEALGGHVNEDGIIDIFKKFNLI